MAINLLSDLKIKAATYPAIKSLNDGEGLSVQLSASAKKFRFRYTRPSTKKINNIILGQYPAMTLKSAREMAQEFREMVKRGIDPANKEKVIEITFDDLAQQYFNKSRYEWSEKHYQTSVGRYNNYLAKPLGKKAAKSITAFDVYQILEAVANAGSYQTAEKLSYIINGTLAQAAALGQIPFNPAAGIMSQVSKTTQEKPMPHFNLTKKGETERFAKFLHDIDQIKHSSIAIKTALQLSPHVFMRTGTLVSLRIEDFDREARLLHIPAEQMKSNHSDFIVPLSSQAFALIDNLLQTTNPDTFIFESKSSKTDHITRESVSIAKRRAGWEYEDATIHGMRHTATTYLTEQGFDYEVTEMQLHHKLQGVRGVYNKAVHLEERRRMMQVWSDFIDELKSRTN